MGECGEAWCSSAQARGRPQVASSGGGKQGRPRPAIPRFGHNRLGNPGLPKQPSMGGLHTMSSAELIHELEQAGWQPNRIRGSHHVFKHAERPGQAY